MPREHTCSDSGHLIEEWKSLRDEIARKQSFVERLVLTTVTGNLAIFAFATAQKDLAPANAFLALLPVVLTSLSYFWILRNLQSGFRIAEYIRECIEPNTSLGWETWLVRARPPSETSPRAPLASKFFAVFYNSLLCVSLIVSVGLIWLPYYVAAGAASPTGRRGSESLLANARFTGAIVVLWLIWYLIMQRLLIGPMTTAAYRQTTLIHQLDVSPIVSERR
jgi:hypothetical protein